MTTDTATDTFADIVADVAPIHHWKCRLCHPEGEPDPEAVCGVLLLDLPADDDSELCDDCQRLWPEHFAELMFGGDGIE
ncbi:hypothetical protein AQF52_7323 [Streptomyces venezuelae]|uniref:hypothetical protein n=1 Tax=Streptomyces gardneri TaxID=66892 RepID=UPI0006BCA131|nr:hypothetical protein [Streptomyces gardneri]ALO12909.1 hypothetical protein AQF52_7323 [Streptomyces venezuelae]QPK49607.1 hypothetical protein H4W23_36730 [Streptomyces gardneri]WRK41156.1 hypothetical protein U0M97_36960 [Streptomyces venezuelae]CUM36429.1 hypothetical protein BN2537_1823 [Streptomyces venezuelae]